MLRGTTLGKPRAPTPPDPKVTAAAQTGTNVSTAVANSQLGNVNQVGPDGSLTYSTSGTYDWTDPSTGTKYSVPRTTATTTLSGAQQGIYDTNTRTQANLSSVGEERSKFLGTYLQGAPITPDDAVRSRYESALMDRMQPGLDRGREALETRLANSGIGMGSRAYSAAQQDFGRNENDARLAAILGAGDEQARDFSVRSAARSAPINEISALLSGSQVNVPQFGINQQSQIPTTDYAGLVNANYGQQVQNYQQKLASRNSIFGGLFGVGAAAVGA